MTQKPQYVSACMRVQVVPVDEDSERADELQHDLRGLGRDRTYDEDKWYKARMAWKKANAS